MGAAELTPVLRILNVLDRDILVQDQIMPPGEMPVPMQAGDAWILALDHSDWQAQIQIRDDLGLQVQVSPGNIAAVIRQTRTAHDAPLEIVEPGSQVQFPADSETAVAVIARDRIGS